MPSQLPEPSEHVRLLMCRPFIPQVLVQLLHGPNSFQVGGHELVLQA